MFLSDFFVDWLQVRLRELRWRRSAETTSKELEYLRNLCHTQQTKIDGLEEELLRYETLLEKRQIDWEARELQVKHSSNCRNLNIYWWISLLLHYIDIRFR